MVRLLKEISVLVFLVLIAAAIIGSLLVPGAAYVYLDLGAGRKLLQTANRMDRGGLSMTISSSNSWLFYFKNGAGK